MEDGGHYYTVYYTSLAVGFTEQVAYRHAVLAQMPDEVGWLDAANLHIRECISREEINLNGVSSAIPNDWRYHVQYGLHSLPGQSLSERVRGSAFQRRQTTLALLRESPVSLKFGLLLHRLGDTYAHSRLNDTSTMYTVTTTNRCFRPDSFANYNNHFGHGHDGHTPDYPFLRVPLFLSYLENLYNVLHQKILAQNSASYRRHNRPRPFHEVRADFQQFFLRLDTRVRTEERRLQEILDRYSPDSTRAPETTNDTKANWFIEEIRNGSQRILQIRMNAYRPETQGGMPLEQFLQNHRELRYLNINNRTLTDTVNSMVPASAP